MALQDSEVSTGSQGGDFAVAEFTIEEVEAELVRLRKEREDERAGKWNVVKAAKVSGLPPPHLCRLCRRELIKAVKIDGAWYIEPSSLLEWMKQQ